MNFTPHPQLSAETYFCFPPYTFMAWAWEYVLFKLYIYLVIATY